VTAAASTAESTGRADVPALAAAGVTVLLWASAFVGIRSAGRSFSPGALSLGRLVVALVALAALGVFRGERLPHRAALRAAGPALLACGLLWFGAYNVALNAGERHVDAGTAAMLVTMGPVLIAVLAGLLLHEGFPQALFAGCAVAFAGVVVIALASANHRASTTGVLLCVAAALSSAALDPPRPALARREPGRARLSGRCALPRGRRRHALFRSGSLAARRLAIGFPILTISST
jgi:drug/metabolite transporter (DMT)-like permease